MLSYNNITRTRSSAIRFLRLLKNCAVYIQRGSETVVLQSFVLVLPATITPPTAAAAAASRDVQFDELMTFIMSSDANLYISLAFA